MKKNLTFLLIVLTLASWSGRYRQNRVEETALEKDLQAGLVELWHDPHQNVRIHDGVAEVQVSRPDAHANFELVKFVSALHPKVRLVRLDLRCGGAPLQDAPPDALSQLETRKAQQLVDALLGEGRGLALVEVEPGPPSQGPEVRTGIDIDGRCYSYAPPPTLSPGKICHVRLILADSSHRRLEGALMQEMRLRPERGDTIETIAWRKLPNS